MMFRTLQYRLGVALILMLPASSHAINGISTPRAQSQPNGDEVLLQVYGDEWSSFHETSEGYSVTQDAQGWWVYADRDDVGRFAPTRHRVGREDGQAQRFLDRVGPHLREDGRHREELLKHASQQARSSILEWMKNGAGKNLTGNIRVPLLLIQYPDFFASQTVSSFDDMMNQTNYDGTGSFRDYFEEISYGGCTITTDVVGWYTAPNNRNYYRHGSGGATQIKRARELVRSAVDQAEAVGTDWTVYDNEPDGNVDVVFVVHQGPGAEGSGPNFIWSHHFYLNDGVTNLSVNYDSRLIDRYIIMPEISTVAPGSHIEIGVFCHEFGHVLGLPDLYDVNDNSEGIGNWGLMGGGGWGGNGISPELPTHMNPWCKIEQNWLTPTVVTTNQIGVSVPEVETNAQVHKLWTNGTEGEEYFLVENRQKTGFDLNLPNEGLAIWHIDESRRVLNNTDNADETHKLVDLEAADGANDMDNQVNRGDAGDVYPGSTNHTTFDGISTPNSDDYAGAPTDVCVDNISLPSSSMTADFCVENSNPPDLLIRDCAGDVGAEPDGPCAGNWVKSLDIWIDNNDDGTIDAPIKGQVNHLYVRGWNNGGPATGAKVKCWYVNPSLGLKFGLGSPGTQITDAITFESEKSISTLGPLAPLPGGLGYRTYFNWLIPSPPPNIDHYCIGCVIENGADPQTSAAPIEDNNLAQINFWALALKAGQTPAKQGRADSTVFREQIEVNNVFGDTCDFLVVVDSLAAGFEVYPDTFTYLTLPPDSQTIVTFDIVRQNPQHKDSTGVAFLLYKLPGMVLAGGLHNTLLIDDVPPDTVSGFAVSQFELVGDNFPRPTPTHTLTWEDPQTDLDGFHEETRYFEIHAANDPILLASPDSTTLVKITKGDDDLLTPGYQYHYTAVDLNPVYFTVIAVDLAGGAGPPAPAKSAEVNTGVAGQGGLPTRFSLAQNTPNPFNPHTSIRFDVPIATDVHLGVYNVGGRLVANLANRHFSPGAYEVSWEGQNEKGQDVASGVYFVKMKAGSNQATRRMVLVR